MQRLVVLFIGILAVARATPFGLDSGDIPTPFRYTFRVEKVEFGNDALSEDPDGYEIGTFESDENSDIIDELEDGNSAQGLKNLFGHLKFCGDLENDDQEIPEEGCIYVAYGDIHFVNALSTVDIDEVYKALDEVGLEECEVHPGENVILNDVPEGGCFFVNEDGKTLHLIGVYDDDLIDAIDDLSDEFGVTDLCDVTSRDLPEESCVLFSEEVVGLVNFLNEENIADVIKDLGGLDVDECVFDEDHNLLTTEQCYWIDEETNSVIFENVNIPGSDDDDIDYDYNNNDIEETYELPDEEVSVSTQSSVQSKTSSGILQQLKSRGLLNRRSSVPNKSKAGLLKRIRSRQQPLEVLQKRIRRDQRKNIARSGINTIPKWMKHFQITV